MALNILDISLIIVYMIVVLALGYLSMRRQTGLGFMLAEGS